MNEEMDGREGGNKRARARIDGRKRREMFRAENSERGLRCDALSHENSWRFSKDEQGLILPEGSE